MKIAKIAIIVPVYIANDLHLEFTETTIASIKTSHEYELVLVNNFCVPEYFGKLTEMSKTVIHTKENNVSASWNEGIKYAIENKFNYALVINNDIIFHPLAIDNLVKFAQEHTEYVMWTAVEHGDFRSIKTAQPRDSFDEHPHFSCFMISPKTVELLKKKEEGTKEPNPGLFDKNFKPAYFEDGDMHNRILRAGLKAGKTAMSLFYHFGSRTIKVDDDLNRKNKRTYEASREYFNKKWGWDPHNNVLENNDKKRFIYKEPFEK